MIKFFFLIFFFVFSTLGYGLFLNKKILKNDNQGPLGEIGLLGLFFTAFYATFFHFFLPLGININISFHILGCLFFFYYHKKFFKKLKGFEISTFFLSLLLALILFYAHRPNEDFGFYHLPYIVNFTNEKIIFGLSSLQVQQGWNSIWLNIHSAFVITISDFKSVYILNSIFFIYIFSIFSFEIIQKINTHNHNSKIIFYFSFLFLLFFLIKFSRLNSYGIDVPANYLLIISVLYFFKTFESKKINLNYFMLICIFILFSITARISNLPFSLLVIYLFFKNRYYYKILFSKFFLFVFFFFSFWVLQQFIYTSCLIIPNELTCFNTLWYDENFIKNFSESTLVINKSIEAYTGNLTNAEYYENFRWVPTWFKRNGNELFEFLMTFCLPIIILLVFIKEKKKNNMKYQVFNNDIFFLIAVLIICIFLWFYNSPVIRMGNHYIVLLIFSILIGLNFFKKIIFTKVPKKIVFSLIIFSFLFLGIKNFNRVNKINDSERNLFWPYFYNVNYNTVYKDNFFLNTIIPTGEPQASVCWDTPFICRTKNFDDISLNKTKKGYLLIKKIKD